MYPPSQGTSLDIEALSGICGSISIACWVVVFSPQIFENFRRSSAEGLSIIFLVAWLLGDIFNILGAVLQRVLPTMTILAVYYTLADIVLLGQCFYYRGFTLRDNISKSRSNGNAENSGSGEHSPLLRDDTPQEGERSPSPLPQADQLQRRFSVHSIRDRLLSLDGAHFSPATPLHPDLNPQESAREPVAKNAFQGVLFNSVVVLLVCISGIFGWWLSNRHSKSRPDGEPSLPEEREVLSFNVLGQVFGYICAALYLGSRIPQLLLNYHRKSTEGISMLFFLFACIGNLTYVMSICAYSPQVACEVPRHCQPGEEGRMYGRYIMVNLSWILGSFGTLLLDAGVFVQYFMYQPEEDEDDMWAEEAITDNAQEAEVRRERRRRRSITFID